MSSSEENYSSCVIVFYLSCSTFQCKRFQKINLLGNTHTHTHTHIYIYISGFHTHTHTHTHTLSLLHTHTHTHFVHGGLHDLHCVMDTHIRITCNNLELYLPDDGSVRGETCPREYNIKQESIYIQGVPGGICQTSGECSLC